MRPAIMLAVVVVAASVSRAGTYTESVDGDLSGDRFAPTVLPITSTGTGIDDLVIAGTTMRDDIEYFRISLPSGAGIASLVLEEYASVDFAAFVAVQAGTTFTEPVDATVPGNLLGYTLFGPFGVDVGGDLLPAMGEKPDTIGFAPPLIGTEHTFWLQQTGDTTDWRLRMSFIVPEPATLGLAAVGGLLLLRRR